MAVIDGTNSDDTLSGGNDSDFLDGLNGDDFLFGGNGRDTLYGGDGSDNISGDNGNDKLYGEDGDDALFGDYGKDTLTGGLGANTFFFNDVRERTDTITDFVPDLDTIAIDASGFDNIGSEDFDAFTYNNDSGALFFNNTQFAKLDSNLDFDPTRDIIII